MRALFVMFPLLVACGESDDKPAADSGADLAACDGTGAFDGCADLDGSPQECPGQDFATTSPASVAWSGNGGFHDTSGFTLVLGPGDRDVVLAIEVPGGLSGPGDVDLTAANATAWSGGTATASVICGGQLRIDAYTPGEGGSVTGLAFLYLGTDVDDCASWPPAVQLGAEFDVQWVDPTCDDPGAEDAPDPDDDTGGGGDDTGGGDDCPGTTVEGCMSPSQSCPDYTGTFDETALGADWWDGAATATSTSVTVTSADGRTMTADVGAALEAGRTYQMDEVAASVTGPDGVVRDKVCGGVLVVDATSTAEAVTGAWFWYIDTADGDCAVWGDVLQTTGRFTAAPVCE